MEISSTLNHGLDGLNSILNAGEATATSLYGQSGKAGDSSAGILLGGDSATLSAAGSSIAQTAGDAGVREDKVASVRTALANGGYSIPASMIAARAVGAMLGEQA